LATSATSASVRLSFAQDSSQSIFMGMATDNTNYPSYLQAANGDGTTASNLTLQPFGGNLSIGTTKNSAPLHVQAITGGLAMRFTGRASPADGYSDISFFNNANTTQFAGIGAANSGLYLATSSAIPITFTINNAEAGRFDSSGNFLVGGTGAGDGKVRITASANAFNLLKMDDTGSTGGNYIQFLNSAGNQAGAINHNGTITVNYGSGSDYRLKENVQPMVGALETVAQLNPCTYVWKADGSAGQGFIAHELQTIIPDAVVGEKDALNEDGSIKSQMVDTSFLVATLTAAIKEQQALITQLQADVAALKGA